MTEIRYRRPLLDRFYQQYLTDENSARFIHDVSRHYTIGTLQQLLQHGYKITRRAAVLAIGFLGDFSQNETMGQALSDPDRAVRLLADHNIRQVWHRQGTPAEQTLLVRLEMLNSANRSEEVLRLATQLIELNQELGEAWNQRAIAFSAFGEYELAIEDCRETLNRNRYHFPAAVGMGHCFLETSDASSALESFRLALRINPDLEFLRIQIYRLEKMMGGK
jgi:tetratricopeptide (TPR) repeat protein